MLNVDCVQCTNYMFAFGANDFSLTSSTITNINKGSVSTYASETNGLSNDTIIYFLYLININNVDGLIGLVHMPLASNTYTLMSGTTTSPLTFTNVYGSILNLTHADIISSTATSPLYYISGCTFTGIYSN